MENRRFTRGSNRRSDSTGRFCSQWVKSRWVTPCSKPHSRDRISIQRLLRRQPKMTRQQIARSFGTSSILFVQLAQTSKDGEEVPDSDFCSRMIEP